MASIQTPPPRWRQITKRTSWCLMMSPLLAGALGDSGAVQSSLPLAITSVMYHERLWKGPARSRWLVLDRAAIAWATLCLFRRVRGGGRYRRVRALLWLVSVISYGLSNRRGFEAAHGVCHVAAALNGCIAIAMRFAGRQRHRMFGGR